MFELILHSWKSTGRRLETQLPEAIVSVVKWIQTSTNLISQLASQQHRSTVTFSLMNPPHFDVCHGSLSSLKWSVGVPKWAFSTSEAIQTDTGGLHRLWSFSHCCVIPKSAPMTQRTSWCITCYAEGICLVLFHPWEQRKWSLYNWGVS